MTGNGDKRDNIIAAFGSDLITKGTTGVPNLLLKYYSQLGITDSQMMLIIQLMYLQTATDQGFPSLDILEQHMYGDKAKIRSDLADLIEKGIININHVYCEKCQDIIPVYSYEPLFEKISEMWACEKVKGYQQMKKTLEQRDTTVLKNHNTIADNAKVFKIFEKEFGRLLSPMEIEQINLWLNDYNGRADLILEALKRAVLLGKHNFKYIDRILLEWHKNNLRTVKEVQAYEANFRGRKLSRNSRSYKSDAKEKNDKFRLLYLG